MDRRRSNRPLTEEEAMQLEFDEQRKRNRVRKPKQYMEQRISEDHVQDNIPIVDLVTDDRGTVAVETSDGRFIKIIEVSPINFNLVEDEVKHRIIQNYFNVLRVPRLEDFQIKIVSTRSDVDSFIDGVNTALEGETDPSLLSFGKDYTRLIKQLSIEQSISRRFFIIIELSKSNLVEAETEREVLLELSELGSMVKSYLAAADLLAIEHDDKVSFYYEVFYFLFNRRSSLFEPLSSRMEKVVTDQINALEDSDFDGPRPPLPLMDIVSPRGIDFRHDDYTIMDGLYYSYIYIRGDVDGYPPEIDVSWLSKLSSYGEGVDLDFFVRGKDNRRVQNRIGNAQAVMIAREGRISPRSSNKPLAQRLVRDISMIRNSLSGQNKQSLHDVSIMITVSSPRLDTLKRRRSDIMADLEINMFGPVLCVGNQREAFTSTLPINYIDSFIFEKSRRNMLSSAIAKSFPFTAYEINDEGGVIIGQNIDNASVCSINIFDKRKYRNHNGVIIGASGSGKTFSMQIIALRLRLNLIQVMIVAPLKGEEFKRAAEAIGGVFVQIAPGSPHTINILDIRDTIESDSDILDNLLSTIERSKLNEKVSSLEVLFSLLMSESYLDTVHKSIWNQAVYRTYNSKGITSDNDSLIDPKTGKYKEMPTLGDLQQELRKMSKEDEFSHNRNEIENIISALSAYVSGVYSTFNGQTNVDLTNMYTVIDISRMTGDALPVGMFIALEFFWDNIRRDRTKRKLVLIDEVWTLIGSDSSAFAASYVFQMYKTIRGYGGAVWSATQDINDFFTYDEGKYGRGILGSAKIKLIFGLEEQELDVVSEQFKFSRRERARVLGFEIGECILMANNNKVPIRITPSKAEYDLITTSREDLEKQAQEIRRRKEAQKEEI